LIRLSQAKYNFIIPAKKHLAHSHESPAGIIRPDFCFQRPKRCILFCTFQARSQGRASPVAGDAALGAYKQERLPSVMLPSASFFSAFCTIRKTFVMNKWPFSAKQKLKAAGLLTASVLLVLGINLLSRKSLSELDHSLDSMYEDRLLPSTYVFDLTNLLYLKRLALEKKLRAESGPHLIGTAELDEHNREMEALIQDFEHTYLTELEDWALTDLRSKVWRYNQLEAQVLEAHRSQRLSPKLEAALDEQFEAAIQDLAVLSKIQRDVGTELRSSSKAIFAGTHLLANFEVSILLIVGLIIQIIIFSVQSARPRFPQRADLN
jgi:hypothetical protein